MAIDFVVLANALRAYSMLTIGISFIFIILLLASFRLALSFHLRGPLACLLLASIRLALSFHVARISAASFAIAAFLFAARSRFT